MPIVKSLMKSLKSRYGAKRGESIYYAMEAEGSGPFKKGNKHHDLHVAYARKIGQLPVTTPKKKAPRPKTRGKPKRKG